MTYFKRKTSPRYGIKKIRLKTDQYQPIKHQETKSHREDTIKAPMNQLTEQFNKKIKQKNTLMLKIDKKIRGSCLQEATITTRTGTIDTKEIIK